VALRRGAGGRGGSRCQFSTKIFFLKGLTGDGGWSILYKQGVGMTNPDERPMCRMEGCPREVMKKHRLSGGRQVYRTVCWKHHSGGELKVKQEHLVCVRCGWLGSCHRHRKEAKGTYRAENVEVLCPNCHAASHGRGEWNANLIERVVERGGSIR